MDLKEFGGMEESELSDIKGVTGVVDKASKYSSNGLKIWQSPNNNDKWQYHYPLDHWIKP